jgi:hypothetical protein
MILAKLRLDSRWIEGRLGQRRDEKLKVSRLLVLDWAKRRGVESKLFLVEDKGRKGEERGSEHTVHAVFFAHYIDSSVGACPQWGRLVPVRAFPSLTIPLICARYTDDHYDSVNYGDIHAPTHKGKQKECFQSKREESG